MVKETAIVDKMIASIRQTYGGFIFKVHGGMFQRKGMPDIIWWYKGHTFGIEAKRGSRYGLTELQKIKLNQLEAEGVHVLRGATTVEEVLEFIKTTLESEAYVGV